VPLSAIAFDSISVAALLTRRDGRIVAANPTAGRMFSIEPAALVGRALADLVPGLTDRWEAWLGTITRDGQALGEGNYDGPRGRRNLALQLAPLIHEGEHYIQVYALDVTSFRAAADAERQRTEASQHSAAQQRLDSLGLVAGGIAHDFNNLLVGVLAEASAAREDPVLAETTREALRRIEASARRMAQLTRQLLAYSGRGQVATVPVAADELLGELREQLARIVPSSIALEVTPGASGAVIEADPGQLRQVVLNLVANAADAGGPRILVETRMASRDGVPCWQLDVVDEGEGMDAATIARIFEPFFSTKSGHHGLGLSAVHGIVRRMSGDIQVESRVQRGSRFRVQLPVSLGAEPQRRQTSEIGIPISKLTGVRVLVADDEPSVRATVRRLLERRGATVVVAADGLEAEARLREEQFQLVVSDVSMPGVDGYEVLITARATQSDVRVVLMSGYTEKLRGQGGEDEPDAFLEKPFTAKVLDAMIDEVLKGS
jgi:signal transduction histidine kinase